MTCAKQFWKKMYTGWVMSIERQGNQGSTIPDTMCVVPYIAFYVSVCYFTKTRSNLLWFWWLQNLAVHTNTYMLHDQLFLILSHLFFHNAIAIPVLKFIFNFWHVLYVGPNLSIPDSDLNGKQKWWVEKSICDLFWEAGPNVKTVQGADFTWSNVYPTIWIVMKTPRYGHGFIAYWPGLTEVNVNVLAQLGANPFDVSTGTKKSRGGGGGCLAV